MSVNLFATADPFLFAATSSSGNTRTGDEERRTSRMTEKKVMRDDIYLTPIEHSGLVNISPPRTSLTLLITA